MKTEYYRTEKPAEFEESVRRSCELLAAGEIVALPTETVYGLCADAREVTAVRKIFEAKGRPQDNPLIVHIADEEMLGEIALQIPEAARRLAEKYWPGPLTMIFPKSDLIPRETSGGLDTVAVRMPSHPLIREVIRRSRIPIAAPSANKSGSPSPTCAAHVRADFDGIIPLIADGGECEFGVESTVITFVTDPPRLLRPGYITAEQLTEDLGVLEIDDAILHPLAAGQRVSSPGMKYRHYAPKAQLTLLKGSRAAFTAFTASHRGEGVFALCFDEDETVLPAVRYGGEEDAAAQASRLFAALRELDEAGAQTVYGHYPSSRGVGLAVCNRILRAAGFRVLELDEDGTPINGKETLS